MRLSIYFTEKYHRSIIKSQEVSWISALSRFKRLKKKCLLFQFYKNFSVYYSSMQWMSTQTRNKRKKWQAGLGITAHKVVCLWPLSGHSGTKCRASREQATGSRYPYSGHWAPKVSDGFWALHAGRRLRYYAWCFMAILWCFDGGFCDTSIKIMIHLWYFFVKYIESLIFVYCYVSDIYIRIQPKRWYFETFFTKKLFSCAYKVDGKSKKYLVSYLIDTPQKYVPT